MAVHASPSATKGFLKAMSVIGVQDNVSISDTAEQVASTPPPVSGSASARPPRPGRENWSTAWDHFIQLEPKSEKRAICKYCDAIIRYENGTSSMHGHVERCPNGKNEGNKRQKTASSSTNDGNISSPSYGRFDQDSCEKELTKLFVEAELPFRLVDHPAFVKYSNVLQPRFNVKSRFTLARSIVTLWDIEKANLKKFLSQHCRRVCLTTDTWTSRQNLNYMCLTAHFIDNDWKLHKKILNFHQIKSHEGEFMAKSIESCLNEWGLNRVFSLTVDNATSNDTGIQPLKKRLLLKNNLVLKGEHIHVRCCAHILNLIVKEGLKKVDKSVLRIRSAVKYIRSSPSRFLKFKECVEQQNIEYKGHMILDVETRWNSTYLMLDAALKHRKAFEELEFRDMKYAHELGNGVGVPSFEDWEYVESILPFLSIFYEATLRISGTSYVTSNLYMLEAVGIWIAITHLLKSNNENSATHQMAKLMRSKFEKYWGHPEKLNMLLLIAVVLDPRYKIGYLNFGIEEMFDLDKAEELKSKLDYDLKLLFYEYNGHREEAQSDTQQAHENVPDYKADPYYRKRFLQKTGDTSSNKTELQKYLEEGLDKSVNLNILDWWKINSCRFPILSNIARELLAMPVSTVASESAFSTGGRVLDPYRSSLSQQKVEALICTQDWLKEIPYPSLLDYDFEELQRFNEDLIPQQDGDISATISLE